MMISKEFLAKLKEVLAYLPAAGVLVALALFYYFIYPNLAVY